MNAFTYCFMTKVIAIAGFVVLVIHEHPLLGACCFIVVASIDGKITGCDCKCKDAK